MTVVVTTFERPRLAGRLIDALAAQRRPADAVVVVDDGSVSSMAELAAEVRARGWTFITQTNQGLSAARNTGAAAATTDWLAFVDDDDVVEDGWLEALSALLSPGIGLASCGARYVDEKGVLVHAVEPRSMGPAYDDLYANMLAGCFVVRRDIFDDAGGYAVGLRCSHQSELTLRLAPALAASGLGTASTPERLIRLDRRQATARPMSSPEALLQGSTFVLARHADRLARDPQHLAGFHAVAGTSAARLERWGEARSHLFRAARIGGGGNAWLRVAVSLVPPLARRVWRSAAFRGVSTGPTAVAP